VKIWNLKLTKSRSHERTVVWNPELSKLRSRERVMALNLESAKRRTSGICEIREYDGGRVRESRQVKIS
jgi:hypothetical protein